MSSGYQNIVLRKGYASGRHRFQASTAAASRSLFQFQGSRRSSSLALVRPETTRSSTSVSHARGSTPFSLAVATRLATIAQWAAPPSEPANTRAPPELIPGRLPPLVLTPSIRFRPVISGTLALVSPDHTSRDHVPPFLQRSPRPLLTSAACSGLAPTPDRRRRGALPHLSYSSTPPSLDFGHFSNSRAG